MKVFWTIALYFEPEILSALIDDEVRTISMLHYFTGNIPDGKAPEFSSNIHEALEFSNKEEAEFGKFMLGGGDELVIEEHQIG